MALASFRTCFLFIHETLAQRVSRGVRARWKKDFSSNRYGNPLHGCNAEFRGFLAQFHLVQSFRFLSLSLSFVKNNFISPLRLFSSFFVSSSFVQFISLRSNEAATEMGGKEMGGKLWIFWLEERDRSQY